MLISPLPAPWWMKPTFWPDTKENISTWCSGINKSSYVAVGLEPNFMCTPVVVAILINPEPVVKVDDCADVFPTVWVSET